MSHEKFCNQPSVLVIFSTSKAKKHFQHIEINILVSWVKIAVWSDTFTYTCATEIVRKSFHGVSCIISCTGVSSWSPNSTVLHLDIYLLSWNAGLNWGPELRAWNEGLKWGPEMRFQNLNSGQRVKNGTFWALFGGFSSLFSSFVCFYVDLMHVRFQFCKKNQSNSFIFDAGALFQKFLTI